MNKPIALIIKETREQIVKALNESQLPPCLLEAVLSPIYQQIAQAAQAEIAQAEKEYKEQKSTGKPQYDDVN